MVVGFNHNFRYKDEIYHVQTEDGGIKSPNIITLLYKGGSILASKKTCYADIAKIDNLEKVVEELMKEQHREMLRRLKCGDLDNLLKKAVDAAAVEATPAPIDQSPPPISKSSTAAQAPSSPVTSPSRGRPVGSGLDEIIFSYLEGEDP
jgi:hypothetical protein